VLFAHALRFDEHEIELVAKNDAKVTVSPATSVRLGMGTSLHGKLPEMRAAGICVSLGTDGLDWGTGDMLLASRLAAGIYKDARMDTSALSSETALELITIEGARAIGLEDTIGSVEVGKKADLVLFDLDRPEWRPLLNPANNLIYNADGRSVHTVLVDGKVLIEAGTPTFVDETQLRREVQARAEALIEQAGLTVAPRWPVVG
jgi:5-methylthioadenosine/S-adenosylhomocysteine deaminase